MIEQVFCVKFSCDGTYLISGSDGTNLRFWKAKASEHLGVDGSLPMPTQEPPIKRLSEIPSPKNGPTVSPLQAPLPVASNSVASRGKEPSRNAGNLEPLVKQMEITPNDEHPATKQRSSEVLERARATIAVAEQATAAARAAAELVNVRVARQASNGRHSG